MHSYLRSIGFSLYQRERDIDNLIETLRLQNMDKARRLVLKSGDVITEVHIPVARNMGISVVGYQAEDGRFNRMYYLPYLDGEEISTTAPTTVQKIVGQEAYVALSDESKVGISLIYQVTNLIDYLQTAGEDDKEEPAAGRLSAFCSDGKILLPVNKTEREKEKIKAVSNNREQLIAAAKGGDEVAMETLTAEDIKTFAVLSQRIAKEDIYSIIDSYFMPQGAECYIYQIIGEIKDIAYSNNVITDEGVFDLTIDSNGLVFHVGINRTDLLGEPEVGRRFKGRIWMQGRVDYEVH